MPVSQSHQDLLREIQGLREVAGEYTRLFPQAAAQGRHWLKVLAQVQAHVAEDLCRVAVVGPVKSGKSTVINALVGRELLKRGAGILTAMITRVQPGEAGAVLKFKDWTEISAEIHRALSFLPSRRLQGAGPPDLQDAMHRDLLAQVLSEVQGEEIWTEGSLDSNYLLLKSFLEGYEPVTGMLPPSGDLSLTGAELARHRDLVTREATAVYLKDVLLTIPFPWDAAGVELGDCQGSDSPIPQHLSQVLAYLVKCDLALYVISSRVGLRQADFQFLGELQRMGLAPHLFFLFNLDLGEHGSIEEAMRLREQTARDLARWQPNPRLYAFSALKLLLDRRRAQGEDLGPREAALLSVWEVDPDLAALSAREAARFAQDLQTALRDLQTRRLAGGSLSQVRMVARGLREALQFSRDLLNRDLGAIKEMEQRLQARQLPLQDTMAGLRQALEGAGQRLKKVLKDRATSLMGRHSGVGAALNKFIQDYEPSWDRLLSGEPLPVAFRPALYQLFQDFVKELEHYVASAVNVTIVEFVREQEEWLRGELARIRTPLLLSLQESLTLYFQEMQALGLPAAPPTLEMATPSRPGELDLPLLTLEPDPGWWLTGEVWVLSGVGFLGRAWEALKRRLGLAGETEPRRQMLRDLHKALKVVKAQLQEQVKVHLLDYGERLKFRYFFPLVDQWLKDQEADLDNALGSLMADLKGMAGAAGLEEEDRMGRRRRLEELLPRVEEVEMRLIRGGGQGPTATYNPSPEPYTELRSKK